ncbi:MAG: cation-transporting P-type ATPase [Candidatus Woesearchaeota archaeon]|nr:MAG: cation-transporting P-type ATPase [Candidatus Woesearchaeota archaeon]
MSIYNIPIEEFLTRVDTSPKGLGEAEAKRRLSKYGRNIIKKRKKKSPIVKFLQNMTNPFALLLLVGSILAFIGNHLSPREGMFGISIALFIVVIINASFTFYQEYKAERAMASFERMMPQKAEVLRDDKVEQILASHLVPGDVLLLKEGDKIPADARLIEVNNLKVNNASLTGESEPQLRSLRATHDNPLESRNLVFSGTIVESGSGKAVIYATGMDTELGKIANLTISTGTVETPIHKEIKKFTEFMSILAIIIGVVFFFIGYFLNQIFWVNLVFAIGIIVANVPEGLLPTITLTLSIASQKMAKRNALIKSIESVETLGSTTVICTDKTGTLTQNKMGVKNIFMNLKDIEPKKDVLRIQGMRKLVYGFILCNNSYLDKGDIIGDPTEGSLLSFSDKLMDYEYIRKKYERLLEIPFDSKRKKMNTINQFEHGKLAFIKGAPEVILNDCDKIMIDDKNLILRKEHIIEISKKQEEYSSRGDRVLAVAYKKVRGKDLEKESEMKNYTFLGLVSLFDPPREEVTNAVKKCKKAGIKIIVFSGDHPNTTKSIAKDLGIVSDNVRVITGDELKKMSKSELESALRSEVLFARSSPAEKIRVAELLQEMGEVVAVTGDGVNDAPALRKADIGVAMGKSGTDVAREAADMVLVDDNFASIVNAIEEGRTVWDNIKRFIRYILTSNIPEIIPFIAFVLLGIPLPLTVILILSIDLGTDMLPGIALGTEPTEEGTMSRPPRSRDERLLTWKMLARSYGLVGPIEALAGFIVYFSVLYNGGWRWGQQLAYNNPLYMTAVAGFFASIIICQIANILVCRTTRNPIYKTGLLKNKFVLLGILSEILITAFILYVPIGNRLFGTNPVPLSYLWLAIPFAIMIIIIDEIIKLAIRKNMITL